MQSISRSGKEDLLAVNLNGSFYQAKIQDYTAYFDVEDKISVLNLKDLTLSRKKVSEVVGHDETRLRNAMVVWSIPDKQLLLGSTSITALLKEPNKCWGYTTRFDKITLREDVVYIEDISFVQNMEGGGLYVDIFSKTENKRILLLKYKNPFSFSPFIQFAYIEGNHLFANYCFKFYGDASTSYVPYSIVFDLERQALVGFYVYNGVEEGSVHPVCKDLWDGRLSKNILRS